VLWDRYMAGMLSEDLGEFRKEFLGVLDVVEYYKLVRIAREEVFEEGDLVLLQGGAISEIRIVLEGELQVLRDGTPTYVLEKGNFVSESGLHSGLMLRGSIESCCSIVVAPSFDPNAIDKQQQQQHQQHGTTNDTAQSTAPRKKNRVRCLRWNRDELIDLLETDKGIATALKAALSWDIVRKLKRQRHMLTEGRVKNPTAWTKKREEQGSARYAAILQNTLMQQETEERKDVSEMLTKYRMIHHIEDADHERALARCGWTDEEFREGKKRRVEVEDEYDEEDDVGTEELQSAQWRRVKRYSSKVVRSLLQ